MNDKHTHVHTDIHNHTHHHEGGDTEELKLILAQINNTINIKLDKIMTDLTQITAEVAEAQTAQQSAIVLLQSLKTKLDEAGTDPVKLKELSDALSTSTDSLAAAVVANTPAEGEQPPA